MHRPLIIRGRRAGTRTVDSLERLGEQVAFHGRVVAGIPGTVARYWREVLRLVAQVAFGSGTLLAGGGSVVVIFGISFFAGSQIGLEGYRGLNLVGLAPLSGVMSAIANTREVAPLVAAIALAAKVGTGFTAQLGAMRISEEIDALDVMAIPSVRYLVTTRVLAAMLAVVPLYLVGLFASYVATAFSVIVVKGQSAGTYGYYFGLFLTPNDILLSVVKVLVFAVVVTLVHCYYGYTATGGPEGVGRAAGRALRTSIVFLAFTDVAMTMALWGLRPHIPGLMA
ncbi:ABC transporter permease [Rhodococcus triatomae]|uniref:Phospholipid/cholesterol/gamma-HCH transport system permease protein n=1 Tax=Rhodococcus triatomae TaxID=300028 RepID=A0A1G7ZTS4_9NOCA|nr:ABC transporter permease [Rhodococcus triatomae]QNG17954.1 ABC transporter permease [Rhodococcus triatomae]QNG22378.1 ABC transporter permease [Rhodococcus triatomae]SDH11916.1 phospholipid/cholesterol/gamma-HCH transport system permease protein [Rhodococcus triatomae]